MKLRAGLAIAAAFVGLSASAYALPITGSFQFQAAATPVNAGVTIYMASGLNFGSVSNFSASPAGSAIGALGSCAANCGTINSIANLNNFSKVVPLFTLNNGLSFDLTSLSTSPIRVAAANGVLASLSVSGTGTYHLAGFNDTFGSFTITTTGTNTYVSLAMGQAIPEPASLVLVGGSLAALGMVRRRRA